ncbi:orotate phosphoribosyltransferase [Amanita muscaria]
MSDIKAELIEHCMAVGALKFGSFTLKSGRISPYFFNAGLLCTGPILSIVANAYADTIVDSLSSASNPLPSFDALFGPAYKGIPFAATTAVSLHSRHSISVGFAYDRKEAKDHGEGGQVIGVSLPGLKVVILDDVMTSGKAIRGAVDMVRKYGGEVVGVVQLLDREEVGQDGASSTVKEVEALIGDRPVRAVLRLRDLMAWLANKGMDEELERMKVYRDTYGLK